MTEVKTEIIMAALISDRGMKIVVEAQFVIKEVGK
jgi:hypothetical protein